VRDREQLRALAQLAGELIAPQPAIVVDVDHRDLRPDLGRELLPRNEVGVMLEDGRHDAVAAFDVVPAPRVRDEVQGLGRVAHEDDLALARRVDEPRDLRAGFLERGGRALAELVDPAVDVRVVLLEDARHRVDHLSRLLAGRRVVEVHERLPAHGLREDREVPADARNVQRRRFDGRGLDGHRHQARPAYSASRTNS
jgi:hypothetical protein